MSDEDLKVQRLRFNQPDIEEPEDKPPEKKESQEVFSLFSEDVSLVEEAIGSMSRTLNNNGSAKALQEAIQKGFQGADSYDLSRGFDFSAANASVLTYEYTKLLDDILEKNMHLSEQDLNKLFKEISGMDIETYKKQKQSGQVQFDMTQISETKLKRAKVLAAHQLGQHGKALVEEMLMRVALGRKEQNDLAAANYQDVLDSEGFVAWMTNGIVWLFGGTTRGDVEDSIVWSNKEISHLKKLAEAKDIEGFLLKYREFTATDFKVENFQELHRKEKSYQKALVVQNILSFADRLKENPYGEKTMRIMQTESKYGANYDFENFDKEPEKYSVLQHAILALYGGDKDMATNHIQTRIKALGIQNKSTKEQYDVLIKEYIQNAETLDKTVFANTSFEEMTKDYKESLKKVYGKNIPQEKIDAYVQSQAYAKAALQIGAIIALSMLAGPLGISALASPLAATATVGGLSLLDKVTAKKEMTSQDVTQILTEMGMTYASFKVFGLVAKPSAEGLKSYLIKNQVAEPNAKIWANFIGGLSGGTAAGAFSGVSGAVLAGERDIENILKSGAFSAGVGFGFSFVFGGIIASVQKLSLAKATTAELKTVEDNLVKALSSDANPSLRALAKEVSQNGLTKELLTKIHRQAGKVYHPDLGGNAETMAMYNEFVDKLSRNIDKIPAGRTTRPSDSPKTKVKKSEAPAESEGLGRFLPYKSEAVPLIPKPESASISPPAVDVKANGIKDALARTINTDTSVAGTLAPYLSVYGAQIPAIPAAIGGLLAEGVVASSAPVVPLAGAGYTKKQVDAIAETKDKLVTKIKEDIDLGNDYSKEEIAEYLSDNPYVLDLQNRYVHAAEGDAIWDMLNFLGYRLAPDLSPEIAQKITAFLDKHPEMTTWQKKEFIAIMLSVRNIENLSLQIELAEKHIDFVYTDKSCLDSNRPLRTFVSLSKNSEVAKRQMEIYKKYEPVYFAKKLADVAYCSMNIPEPELLRAMESLSLLNMPGLMSRNVLTEINNSSDIKVLRGKLEVLEYLALRDNKNLKEDEIIKMMSYPPEYIKLYRKVSDHLLHRNVSAQLKEDMSSSSELEDFAKMKKDLKAAMVSQMSPRMAKRAEKLGLLEELPAKGGTVILHLNHIEKLLKMKESDLVTFKKVLARQKHSVPEVMEKMEFFIAQKAKHSRADYGKFRYMLENTDYSSHDIMNMIGKGIIEKFEPEVLEKILTRNILNNERVKNAADAVALAALSDEVYAFSEYVLPDVPIKDVIRLSKIVSSDELSEIYDKIVPALDMRCFLDFSSIMNGSKLTSKVYWWEIQDRKHFNNIFELYNLYKDTKNSSVRDFLIMYYNKPNVLQKGLDILKKYNVEDSNIILDYFKEIINSPVETDRILRLLKLKESDGTTYLTSSIRKKIFRDPEYAAKFDMVISECEKLPLTHILDRFLEPVDDTAPKSSTSTKSNVNKEKQKELWEAYIKIKDTKISDTETVGADIALVYASQVKAMPEEDLLKLILATNAKGKRIFTKSNIINILKNETHSQARHYVEKSVTDALVEYAKNIENQQLIDFVSNHTAVMILYKQKTLEKLAKYDFMGTSDLLEKFVYRYTDSMFTKNKKFIAVFASNDPVQIKRILKEVVDILDSSIDFSLLDKINKLPVDNELKQTLAFNMASISKSGIDDAMKYFKTLDKKQLAECSNEIKSDMLFLLASYEDSKDIGANLLMLNKIFSIQKSMNELEQALFSPKLEELSANFAKKLESVIIPAKTTKEDMVKFFRSLMFNADAINGKSVDSVLSSPEFAAYLEKAGKDGVGLSFSRADFIAKLNEKLASLDDKTVSAITEKMGIEFTFKQAKLNELPVVNKPASTFEEIVPTQEDYAAFEKENLSDKAKTSVQVVLAGKPTLLLKYENSQKGSNEAYFAKDDNGEIYYIKFPSSPEAAAQEVLASKLYREAGILTPEISFVRTSDNKVGIASKVIPATQIMQDKQAGLFQQGFAVDAWLANWDIFKNNNAEYSSLHDTVIRMDVGGSLEYRARGEKKFPKDFDYKVKSLESLLSDNINNPMAILDVATLRDSMERVISMSDDKIRELVAQSHCPSSLAENLIARKIYIANIYSQLATVNPEEIASPELLSKLDMNVRYSNGSAFDGILTDVNLNPKNPTERQIKNLVQRFMYKNEIVAENPEIKEVLTQLIKAFPEYISIIGKQQHGTHVNSLDGHIFSVLNKAINAPEYKTLSKQDKMVLKFAILFHDISKAELLVDQMHPKVSSYYVRDILKRVNLPVRIKERIIELIETHHWFKTASSNPTDMDMKEIVTHFRRNGDLTLAKIMAEADLSSIRPGFEKGKIENMPKIYKELQRLHSQYHSSASFSYTTPFFPKLLGDKAKVSYTKNGKTYNISVLNFANNAAQSPSSGLIVTDMTDMRELGFLNGGKPVSKDSLSFFAHATKNPMDIHYLSDITSNADICASNITLEEMQFYRGINATGVILAPTEQANVGSSYDSNQGSGYHKNFFNFTSEIWAFSRKDGSQSAKKENISTFRKEKVKQYLQSKKISLTDEEYAEIHKIMTEKLYSSHIHSIRLSTGKVISEKNIQGAILYADRQIRAKSPNGIHNETNIYAPKVMAVFATENSLDDVPVKLLQAAEELGVPIFLFGKRSYIFRQK